MRPSSYDGTTAIRNPSGTATTHASSRQYQWIRRGAARDSRRAAELCAEHVRKASVTALNNLREPKSGT